MKREHRRPTRAEWECITSQRLVIRRMSRKLLREERGRRKKNRGEGGER